MHANPATNLNGKDSAGAGEKALFWACFIALIATAFGFIVRTQIMDDWARQFNLSETQKGEIFGVGLWPFAISIVLFSLIIDRIGYGVAMAFAFVAHIASAIITIMTPYFWGDDSNKAYWILYVGTFIVALANGTVEAVINPVVATLFPREKTKWLNILHAGWPGGLVLGGVLAIAMGNVGWQYKMGLLFLPVIGYGLMMIGRKFPVNERVAAGVSDVEMMREVGFFGALLVTFLIVSEVTRVLTVMGVLFGPEARLFPGWTEQVLANPGGFAITYSLAAQIGVALLIAALFGGYVRSLGQPLFIFLLMIMVPLATTELGTDTWISDLMAQPMREAFGFQNAGWLLVYTSLIMMVLRFFAGPIVHKLSPLGLLAMSAALAAVGLVFLSKAEGTMILAAATLYGFGKTFFWPTMLGVVAEQFPKGGALTLNTCGGVGMLAVGVVGATLLGNIQDKTIDRQLELENPQLHAQVVAPAKVSVFGKYQPVDKAKVEGLPEADQKVVTDIQAAAKKSALMNVAIFPCIMLACYVALILYFQAKGGYKPKVILDEKEEQLLMTGGAAAADEF